ncbi:MAG: ubiquinol-cytochrome c reductase iron-sulfur subunit [Alphaproteobacteria bacterium]|nr:ubiquinol-cytochrome c reductase iron-sulfur subunit [Alphaproteobacteria bacterium]
MKERENLEQKDSENSPETRRDFLMLATATVGAVGVASLAWPFINSMNPAAYVLALATTEVELASLKPGQAITVVWHGSPVFVRYRTEAEIAAAAAVTMNELPDPQADATRVKKPQYLVVVGICTHLGCVPLGQRPSDPKGEFGGWFCPCHGSQYDTSGRIRKGPAPRNLDVPPYVFKSDTTLLIG